MNSQFCTCKSCHISLLIELSKACMAAEVLKYQARQSAVSLSNSCSVLQTNREAINKKFKISPKPGAIPKINNNLFEVKCRQEWKKKKRNPSKGIKHPINCRQNVFMTDCCVCSFFRYLTLILLFSVTLPLLLLRRCSFKGWIQYVLSLEK